MKINISFNQSINISLNLISCLFQWNVLFSSDAFDMQFGVGILRVKEGFQCDPNFVDPPRKDSHKVTVEEGK